MDLRELRIGNYIDINGKPYRVESLEYDFEDEHRRELYIEGNYDYNYAIYANPIPITEEWLVNMGFERSAPNYFGKHHYYIKGGLYSYRLIKDSLVVDEIVGVELKYVHELQNLYFALTGKELTLTPTPEYSAD